MVWQLFSVHNNLDWAAIFCSLANTSYFVSFVPVRIVNVPLKFLMFLLSPLYAHIMARVAVPALNFSQMCSKCTQWEMFQSIANITVLQNSCLTFVIDSLIFR